MHMFWMTKPVFLVLCFVLLVNMFYLIKIPSSTKRTSDENIVFRPVHKLEKGVEYEELMSVPNEPNTTLLSELFTLSNFGINGSGVFIDMNKLPREEAIKFNISRYQREYSSYVSSVVPLQRRLPDIRLKECVKVYTPRTLPKVSVVIVFHDEHWSTVLRTVHSVLDNSPPHLIQEVVLVDDASTDDVLKEPLDEYVARNLFKVSIHHTITRHGMSNGRNLGCERSSAPVLVFLDSRCECFPGWLEPLVARIADNMAIITIPVIHEIQPLTFGINIDEEILSPYIEFPELQFSWRRNPERYGANRRRPTDPYPSPAMMGSVIAVKRAWFKKLGMFDPGMKEWGGENIELSLKTWMCGGALEILPCSNVGHLNYPKRYYDSSDYRINIARVANVWMDNYKVRVLNHNGVLADYGNISGRLQLRRSLHCQSFNWYLKTVSPETYFTEGGVFAGEIRNVELDNLCIGTIIVRDVPNSLKLHRCRGSKGVQSWVFTGRLEIRNQELCFEENIMGPVALKTCTERGKQQKWGVEEFDNGWRSVVSNSGQCLSVDRSNFAVTTELCTGVKLQMWRWKKLRHDL